MQAQETDSHKVALLIEGHPDVEAVVRTVLEPYGWQIVLARDNATALEQVKLRGFELIVTGARTSGSEDVKLLR